MLNNGPGAGGGRKKKEVKTATFPTLLTMIVVLQALASRIFFSVLKSLVNCPSSYAKDKGVFRGSDILDEGKEGGGSLQGHQQLAYLQTLPPPPVSSEKKYPGFF